MVIIALGTLLFGVVLLVLTRSASAATSAELNFQARLQSNTGVLIPDGNYHVEFKLYDAVSGGSLLWTETYTTGNLITVKNGYLTTQLGSLTAFPGTIDWSQELWLSVNVGGNGGAASWDGEMSPRLKLTAVPYAFSAGSVQSSVGALTGDELVQLAPSTIQSIGDAVSALRINQTGLGGLLQLQGDGSDVFTVSKNGETTIGGGLKVGNSTSTIAGTIRWTGADLEVYSGAGWVSLTTGSGGGGSTGTSVTYTAGLKNAPANTTGLAVETLIFTSATAVSNTAGVTGFTAPADGSFRACLVKNNANVTGGTFTIRWRVNGVSTGSGVCQMSTSNNRQRSELIDGGTVTFNAGDTIGIAVDTVGLAPTTDDFTVYWTVEYNNSATSSYFQNGGNDFGGLASLGTSAGTGDGLNIITDGATRLSISATGDTTFYNGLTASNGLTISSGGLDLNTTGLTNAGAVSGLTSLSGSSALTLQSGGAGDLTLDSASDVLILSDPTLRRIAAGTTTIDLSDNTADTTLSIQNSDGTYVAGLNVEGGITASSFSGDGSGLTDLNGNEITSGTIDDARLSANVTLLGNTFNGTNQLVQLDGSGNLPGLDGSALTNLSAANLTGVLPGLDGSALINLNASSLSSGTVSDSLLTSNVALLNGTQTFTAEQTFNGGLVIGGGGSAVAGTIRWNGVDLELYDGSSWVSLTSGGGSGPLSVAFIQAYDTTGGTDLNTGTPTAVPWDSETKKDTGFTHSNVTNNTRIYLDDPGWYKISYNISGANQSANRNTTFCQVRMNGSTYNTPSGSYSYARNTTDAYTTNSSSVYIQTTAANEYYEVLCSQAGSSGAQYAVAGSSWTIAELTTTPTGGSGISFDQGGNSFGSAGVLGTTDTNGLSVITDGTTRVTITSSGDTTFLGSVTISSGGLDLNTTGLTNAGAVSGLTSLSGSSALTLQSGGAGDLTLDSASDVLILSDPTLRRIAAGTTTIDLSDNTADTTLSIQNSDGTYVAGLNVEGGITASSFSGDGSGLTDLNGNEITSGTIDDARLSANVTLLGNTFNGTNQLVQLDGSGLIVDSLLTTNIARLDGTQSFSGTNTYNSGGIVLGLSTFSTLASSSRSIVLPDASGTLCISGTAACGFVLFGQSSAQVDSSTDRSIYINKTGASGNILELQRSGTGVFTIANSGAVSIMLTDTAALSVNNAGGTQYLGVDTSGGIINIGSSTTDATSILFVLDSYNSGTDPSGYAGAMYYNSSLDKFRCYEGGSWKDCIGTRQVRSFVDTTSDAAADNNTTDYWDTAAENNNSFANLTPSSTAKSITGSVSFETQETGSTADRSIVARVERGIGSPPTCGSGTPVGTILSTFTTNNNEQASNTMIFLDSPSTTSTVYYTLCADTATSSAANMTINRIRITLEEANNTN
ncbi:hypothetical protein H6798_02135 [Candidatus Nomurabacteria bacterium]|nr:hypothetical protein [Candidatus Nomurabacteria bacterium]